MRHRKGIAPRRWLLAALISVSLMLLSLSALAGRVQIRDTGGLFNAADTSALRNEGDQYPFDVRIVASTEHAQKAEFDRYVRAQVNEPNVVVVGVDREHRFTSVHFGTGLGVPPAQYKSIQDAGDRHFREGNWRAGVEAILSEARSAAHAGSASSHAAGSTQPGPQTQRSTAGSTIFMGLVALLVVGGVIAFVGSMLSRRARAGELGPPGYPPGGPGPYPPGGPYPPCYGPGPGHYGPGYGGGSGIGAGIAGAGLGGLVGYELGKMAGERRAEHPHHDDQSSAGVTGADDRDNYDAGGSTGGWDDDTGGGDWGGGDGGGGDWGGGGGDSGGSDW